MASLSQIVAVVRGKKSRTQSLLTESHRGWNKEAISGITKRYTPHDDNGEKLPGEQKLVQLDARKGIADVVAALTDFYNVVATQEWANTGAVSDVVVDNKAILFSTPVTVLLFLEKQLEDLRTFVSALPTLPPDREWRWDAARNCYATNPVDTVRSLKEPQVLVKYPATTEHPAQTEVYMKDVPVGTWVTVYMSSAIPAEELKGMLARVVALQDSVKMAREHANSIDAPAVSIGKAILSYVFGVQS